jgi:hypothetical protein
VAEAEDLEAEGLVVGGPEALELGPPDPGQGAEGQEAADQGAADRGAEAPLVVEPRDGEHEGRGCQVFWNPVVDDPGVPRQSDRRLGGKPIAWQRIPKEENSQDHATSHGRRHHHPRCEGLDVS